MKLRAAVCLNLSLNISESLMDFLRTVSISDDDIRPLIPSGSNLRGHPNMKLSSEMVMATLAPIMPDIL